MKISLLGGAYNPATRAHVLAAQQVLLFTDTDEVWFLPNWGQTPPKDHMASPEDRLAMVRMIQLPRTKVCTIEIDHKLDGQTIHLLQYLPPEHNYHFVIGSDQLPAFHLWGQWEELLRRMPFYVLPRYGYPNEPLYEGMTLVHNEAYVGSNLSATKVRSWVKAGYPIDELVPEGVGGYIREHGLYK